MINRTLFLKAILSSATRADGFVIVPAASEGLPEGAPVDVHFYDGWALEAR